MPTSSLATIRPQGLEHEAQLVSNLLRLSRVTVLLGSQGSDAGTFLKNYVMPLLATGPGAEDTDVCVFFDTWEGAPHLALLAEARSAASSVKGTPATIPDTAPLSLDDALTAWQEALRVRFILVLDRFEEFLERPADEVTLQFHRELVDLLKNPRLRINVLISIDEKADALLAPLREAVPGFGGASLRLPGPARGAAEANTPAAPSSEPSVPEITLLKTVGAASSINLAAAADAPISEVPSSAVAASTTHPAVEASPASMIAEPRIGEGESISTAAPKVAPTSPASAPSRPDSEVKPVSRASLIGWSALTAFLVFLLGLWILTPESKRPPSPRPQASTVPPPQPTSVERQPDPAANPPAPASTPGPTAARDRATGPASAAAPAPAPDPLRGPASQPAPGPNAAVPVPTAPVPAAPVQTAPAAPLVLKAAPAAASVEKKGALDLPMLHIHVRDQSQRAWAETLVARLARRGIRVSGIRLVPSGPSTMDVRYFRPHEAQEASDVARALRDLGIGAPQVKHIRGYEDAAVPRRYELWLGPVGGPSNR